MKFAYTYRQSIAFALYISMLAGIAAPAMARPVPRLLAPAGGASAPQGRTPSAAAPAAPQSRSTARTGKLIPDGVTRRSLVGAKGFDRTRLQVGGTFGANIQEQVIDITNIAQDERHPFFSPDEQFILFASNRAGGNYQLFRTSPNPSPNPGAQGLGAFAITNEAAAVHDFPVLNATGSRIAYIKSTDNGATFQLYQTPLPGANATIVPQPLSDSLSANRVVGGETITSVGRPAWVSATEIVFSATFASGGQDLVIADFQSRILRRLTSGAASEENVAVSPDGNFIAFDANTSGYNGSASTGATAARNIFVIAPTGGAVTRITNVDDGNPATPAVAAPTVSSVQPAWSRSNVIPIFGTQSRYFLAFSSNRVANPAPSATVPAYAESPTRDIFYVTAVSVNANTQVRTLLPEVSNAETRQLDTRDTARVYNDEYPSWPPLINLQRLVFQSNRKGSSAIGFTPHTPVNQNDLFIASLLDITAPTLLRYDLSSVTGEVVHINPGKTFNAGASVRSRSDGLTPGASMFFTVRTEDLEAGVKSVYLQFKNPNSKYQAAAQGGTPVEHKEYVASQAFGLASFVRTEVLNAAPFELWLQPTNATPFDRSINRNNLGIEYECEVVSAAQALATGASSYFQHRLNRRVTQTAIGLGGGLYEAGIDDLTAFTGSANPPPLDRSVADNPAIDNDNGIWLKLDRLPQASQDGNGGVLYGATWNAPSDASDWYVDVVLYDNAVNPFNPAAQSNWIIYDNVWGFSTALGLNADAVDLLFVSDYALGQKFQITRFGDPRASAGTASNVRENVPLVQFGAESYYTDRDLTDALDGVTAIPAPFATTPPTNPRFFDTAGAFFGSSGVPGSPFGTSQLLIHNPLGYGSYTDNFLDSDSTSVTEISRAGNRRITGIRPSVGRYSIWRILSRGAVPANVLSDYLPTPSVRPPDTRIDPTTVVVDDPATPADETFPGRRFEDTLQTVAVVNRAIVWASPFAATSFRGAGAIADQQTQSDLTNYVRSGGRMFISGQDVAFALGNGNPFLAQILGASLVDGGAGAQSSITAAAGSTRTQQIATDAFEPSPQRHAYMTTTDGVERTVSSPSAGEVELTFIDNQDNAGSRGDTSFTSLGSAGSLGGRGFLDAISSTSGSQAVFNYTAGGTPAMLYNAVDSGEVVFAAFGFESITDLWREYTPTGAMFSILSNNARRAEIMHNITDSFRTGAISGRILDDNGSPVSDAVVYAARSAVAFATGTKAISTGLTDANGNYNIVGLPPGFYVVIADRAGFYRQASVVGNVIHGGGRASVNLTLKRANPGRLAGVRYPAGFVPKAGRPVVTIDNKTVPQGGVFRTDDKTGIGGVTVLAYRTEATVSGIGRVGFVARTSTGDPADPQNINATGRLLNVGEYEFATQLPIGGYTVICNPRAATTNGQPLAPDGSNAPVDIRDAKGAAVTALATRPEFETVIVVNATQTNIDLGVDDPTTPGINEATAVVNGQVLIETDKFAGVDFRLKAAPQPINGEVREQKADGTAGAGIKGVTVTITGNGLTVDTVTGDNGVFTARNTNNTPTDTTDDSDLFPEGLYTIAVTGANGFDLTASPGGTSTRPAVTVQVGGDSGVAVRVVEPRDETQPLVKPGALIIAKLPPGSVSGLVTRVPGAIPTEGATVNLYGADAAGNRLDGDADTANGLTPAYTTQTTTVQTAGTYRFNYRIANVGTGTYVADAVLRGYSPSPTLSSVFVVTSGNEVQNINFILESPKIYGGGVQLISIPLDYTQTTANTDPRLIFGLRSGTDINGDGATNTLDEALFSAFNVAEWTGGPDYQRGPTIPLGRGKGYFVRFGAATAVTNSDGAAASGNEYVVNLLPGWNLIGHPFARTDNPYALPADIDLASSTRYIGADGVEVSYNQAITNGLIRGVAYGYTGENSNSQYFQSSLLKPWLGYWFRNTSASAIQMKFLRPTEAGASRSVKPGRAAKPVTRAEQEKLRFRSIDSKSVLDWRLQIAVRQGDLLDTDNSVGIAPGAKDGFDTQYDTEKPPVMTAAPQVYVSVEGKSATGGRAVLADDIRDGSQVGVAKRTWDFAVTPAAGKGDVTVFWPNVNRLPRGVEPFLVDAASGKRVPMRSASSYTYTPGNADGGRSVHRFRVEVAKPSSVPLMLTKVRQTRVDGRGVGQSGYRIGFQVTREADITAEVQTLTGRTVTRLVTRARGGVEGSLFWNGRSQEGSELPAGAYVMTLTARDSEGSVVQMRQPILSLR